MAFSLKCRFVKQVLAIILLFYCIDSMQKNTSILHRIVEIIEAADL